MSLPRGTRRPGAYLRDRLDGLERATAVLEELGTHTMASTEPLRRARDVLHRAGERQRLSTAHAVVAFAGATGSGKSSLVNAITGTSATAVGARRPTTATPVGIWAGDQPGAELLDWLQVRQRHCADIDDGLILVDLPDVDSVRTDHHRLADAVIDAVDVLVWVLDPQKYADAVVHTRYLQPMAQHAEVTLVVLNQVDLLTADAQRQVLADLHRYLDQDGIAAAQVLATSATAGTGIGDLWQMITRFTTARSAAHARLQADVTRAATDLATAYPPPPVTTVPRDQAQQMHAALARAAGVEQVAATVAASFRYHARGRTGWPPTRWLRRFRPDPLQRLRLPRPAGTHTTDQHMPGEQPVTTITSRPGPDPAAVAQVDAALARIGRWIARDAAEPWHTHLRNTMHLPVAQVTDALDATVVHTTLRPRPARWWPVIRAVHWVFLALLAGGALWLTVLAVAGYLQIGTGAPPLLGPVPLGRGGAQIPPVPWPTAMFMAGLIGGLLFAAIARVLTRVGARRRRNRTTRDLTRAVAARAEELILQPARQELQLAQDYRRAIDQALPGGIARTGCGQR